MSPDEGLVVVVPRGYDWARIPAILEQKQRWISRTAGEVERRRQLVEPAESLVLPETVNLRFVSEEWEVEYAPGGNGSSTVRAQEAGDRVVRVTGNIADDAACRHALTRWVLRKGRDLIVPAARDLAWAHGFNVDQVSIRRQKSRWGSCSRHKALSLNVNLLFLEPYLVEYVLLHELCHTIHLDHSRAFWAVLAQYDPDWRAHRRELRAAGGLVPGWLE
jgi:hypothetical protein